MQEQALKPILVVFPDANSSSYRACAQQQARLFGGSAEHMPLLKCSTVSFVDFEPPSCRPHVFECTRGPSRTRLARSLRATSILLR